MVAKIIKEVSYHNCLMEITGIDRTDLWIGSIVECSCGQQFIKSEDQRNGPYWQEMKSK